MPNLRPSSPPAQLFASYLICCLFVFFPPSLLDLFQSGCLPPRATNTDHTEITNDLSCTMSTGSGLMVTNLSKLVMFLTTSSIKRPSFVFSVLSSICHKVTPHFRHLYPLFFFLILILLCKLILLQQTIKCWCSVKLIPPFQVYPLLHLLFMLFITMPLVMSQMPRSPKSVSRPDPSPLSPWSCAQLPSRLLRFNFSNTKKPALSSEYPFKSGLLSSRP